MCFSLKRKWARTPRVWDPDKIAYTFDLQAPSHSEKVSNNQKIIREFAKRQGIKNLFDINHGIGQHVMLEAGLIKPGDVVLGTDSHMNLLGAVGAFATGRRQLRRGRVLHRRPELVPRTGDNEDRGHRQISKGRLHARSG